MTKNKRSICFLWLFASFFSAPLLLTAQDRANDDQQIEMAARTNSSVARKMPYVVLISLDGFRYDYAKKYGAVHLLNYAANGVAAERMYASYPSKTFPNHYSIVTGLYPAHHGIVDNSFYDPSKKKAYALGNKTEVQDGSWYGGTPLWVLAEKQHLLSASFFWVGSEAAIQNIRPTYYYRFNDHIPASTRIDQLISWLRLPTDKRPHLLTYYFSDVDHAGHNFGPEAAEVGTAVRQVDSIIGVMKTRVDSLNLPVNFIVVSDHGMAKTNRDHPINLNRDSLGLKDVKVFGGETQLNLYFDDKSKVAAAYHVLKSLDHRFDVYLKKDVPRAFHYSTADDRYNRIGDIVLLSHFPEVFGFTGRKGPVATHGYDPEKIDEMGAIFYAWGPAFKSGLHIKAFGNVNVYPLIAHILGLKITEPNDGNLAVLRPILR